MSAATRSHADANDDGKAEAEVVVPAAPPRWSRDGEDDDDEPDAEEEEDAIEAERRAGVVAVAVATAVTPGGGGGLLTDIRLLCRGRLLRFPAAVTLALYRNQ